MIWLQAVADHLATEGYRIDKVLSTVERGVDVVAVHPATGRRLLVEAKGGTSSKAASARLGKPFDSKQAKSHVSVAFYYAAKLLQQHSPEGAQVALLDVVNELQASPTLIVRLRAFSDLTGTRDYNYGLAQRRVEAVWRFLEKKGVELSRVQEIRMGPLDDRRTPEDKKRRVTVTLMADLD